MKNAIVYRLGQDSVQTFSDIEAISELIAGRTFVEPEEQQARRMGFVPVLGGDAESLVETAGGRLWVTLLIAEKKLSSAAIKRRVDQRAEEMARTQGHPVAKRDKQAIKERIIEEMLSTAEVGYRRVDICVDAAAAIIIVDASSPKTAETVLDVLRETLGSLKVAPFLGIGRPERSMTRWVTDAVILDAENMLLGDECKLVDKSGDASAVIKGQSMDSDGVQAHIANGMQCASVLINAEEVARFTLTDQLHLKGLKFADALLSETDELESEVEVLQATMMLEAQAVSTILARLNDSMALEFGEPIENTTVHRPEYDSE